MLTSQRFTLGSAPAYFGSGAIDQLPSIFSSLGYRRAFLVTDRGVAGAGISGEIEQILQDAGVITASFDAIEPNPSTETLDAGAKAARTFGPAAVVAVGGGSVLDAAKGVALMATNQGSARDFDYRKPQPEPGAPLIAIPTTAGTGSETNAFGVIDHLEERRKFYVGHESVLPRAVILDPQLTVGLPSLQTAATGMDVLTHALESLSSRRSNPYAEGINLQIVKMVMRFLPRATADGQDLEARAQMLLAAHMAGLAFATTGLGVGHAVAHALSARIGAAHGAALAVLLPHVLSFNLPVRAGTYATVARALKVSGQGDERADAQAAVDAVRRFSRDLGMPDTLRDMGCAESVIPDVVEDAIADEVIENTPRMPTEEELRMLVRAAL